MGETIRTLFVTGATLTLLVVGPALGQHDHGGHGGPTPPTPHGRAEECRREFEAVIAEGRGFGMAFAADQHGYPGPLHVLELKDRLGLTPTQEAGTRALMETMFAESRPKSARLLASEARLHALFASGAAEEVAVRAAVAEVEVAQREVRLVHLLTHVRTRALLTEAQIAAYTAARWPAR
jgi:Spy/CpxP family protein refolding chaperone